jgi:GT2 family glycosyltransferase
LIINDYKKLSIIIANYNAEKLLEECLKSIYEGTKRIWFEISVVDNKSSDASTLMVKEKFPNVKLIENERNEGFIKANNKIIGTK